MQLLDADNAAEFLRRTGRIGTDEAVRVTELAGGVSNVVLRVERSAAAGGDFIVKQARERLRVAEAWFCSVERIEREVNVLRVCGDVLGADASHQGLRLRVPELLWQDRAEFAYGMSAADATAVTWKERLLAGDARVVEGAACGDLLGRLHAETWGRGDLAAALGNQAFFNDLRLDPYYRQLARVRPESAAAVEELLAESAARRRCLVHGDYSPKNILLAGDDVMLLDFEVGHYGDPAFDLGFFFTHLVLKEWLLPASAQLLEIRAAAWQAYAWRVQPRIDAAEWNALRRQATRNLGACLAARVDGKSRVEYLTPTLSARARQVGGELLQRPDGHAAEWFPSTND